MYLVIETVVFENLVSGMQLAKESSFLLWQRIVKAELAEKSFGGADRHHF